MITGSAAHLIVAGQIQRLIHEEQYAEAQELLPSFVQAVVQTCNATEQEQEFLRAKEFLQSVVLAVKARRAHYGMQMDDLRRQRAYAGTSDRQFNLDFTG